MENAPVQEPPPQITGLFRPEELQTANAHIWPSMGSFSWWERQHRDALHRAGAVRVIAGRKFFHGERTIRVALGE